MGRAGSRGRQLFPGETRMNSEALTCPPRAACGVGAWRGPAARDSSVPAGKAHLRRALLGQEAALQLHAVCRALRREDLLQAVLARALRRSLAKYSELDLEDDFHEATEAPDVQRKQRPWGGCVFARAWVAGGRQRPLRSSSVCHTEGPRRRSRAAVAAPRCSFLPRPHGRQTPEPPGSSCWWCPGGPEYTAAPQATTLGP